MKNTIKSTMYTPKELQLAHELADALEDQKSLAFYLSCAKKYPREFLAATLMHVLAMPGHSVRTTRARLFTNIVTNSIYNTNDHIWD
jgi:hypothetical protein